MNCALPLHASPLHGFNAGAPSEFDSPVRVMRFSIGFLVNALIREGPRASREHVVAPDP